MPDLRDIFVFGGLALSALGLALIHFPTALVISGAALFGLGYFGGRK